MVDFRETFNIENGNVNSSSCNDDNVQDSAILVRRKYIQVIWKYVPSV